MQWLVVIPDGASNERADAAAVPDADEGSLANLAHDFKAHQLGARKILFAAHERVVQRVVDKAKDRMAANSTRISWTVIFIVFSQLSFSLKGSYSIYKGGAVLFAPVGSPTFHPLAPPFQSSLFKLPLISFGSPS